LFNVSKHNHVGDRLVVIQRLVEHTVMLFLERLVPRFLVKVQRVQE
jgi:hypothetical protein